MALRDEALKKIDVWLVMGFWKDIVIMVYLFEKIWD